jgi:hypothetical protein
MHEMVFPIDPVDKVRVPIRGEETGTHGVVATKSYVDTLGAAELQLPSFWAITFGGG